MQFSLAMARIRTWLHGVKHHYPRPLLGDWLVMVSGVVLVYVLFATLWQQSPASKLQIRVGDKVYGTYSLDQTRVLMLKGALGETRVVIRNGQVRFEQSPCHNQYCVHQGWLKRAGQAAFCIPNQVSLELIGEHQAYDSLNY